MLEQYISVRRVLRMIRKLDAELFQKDKDHTGKDLIALSYLITNPDTPTIWVERKADDRLTRRERTKENPREGETKRDI